MILDYFSICICLLLVLFNIDLHSAAGLTEPYYTNFYSDQQPVDYKIKAALDRLDHGPQYVPDWPNSGIKFGQVSGVAIDNAGNIVAFHRASNVWDGSTFTDRNVYTAIGDPPIASPTILVLNDTGDIIDQWGENLFYMPHGITVDSKGNIWVTDVALHQVFKFSPNQKKIPEMVLGEKFVPGADDAHYCKPAAVAVARGGDFFVADGYCNSRIVKYAADGTKLLQWGRRWGASPYTLAVPHALALCEREGAICVADRERGRVACFGAADGEFRAHYRSWLLGERIFGVAYSDYNGGQLYVVTGASGAAAARGYVLSYPAGRVLAAFQPPRGLRTPHAVAASDAGDVYVAEIQPYALHRFAPAAPAPAAPAASPSPSSAPAATSESALDEASERSASVRGGGAAGAAGAAGAGAAALLLLLALWALRARRRPRGASGARRRWEYGAAEFKLRRLLERRRFTRVHSDDSEDEPAPMLPPDPDKPASPQPPSPPPPPIA